MPTLKIAIVQHKPVFNNLPATLDKATHLIQEAVSNHAQLIVFGETWFSGYPAWIDHIPGMGIWDYQPTKKAFRAMFENSLIKGSEEMQHLQRLAAKHHIYMVVGFNERLQSNHSQGTIYNSLVVIDNNGHIINHHRKLMPTYTEKLLYGVGDGHGLTTVPTPFGKLGGLICWEHWMPLTRQAMHNQGEQIHVALWPTVHDMHQIASRHYAFEGRCFVIAVGQLLQAEDLSPYFDLPTNLANDPTQYLLTGGSCVIGPNGQYLLKPQFNEEKTLLIDIPDSHQTLEEMITLDVSGHYQRNDIFSFSVDRERKSN